MRQAHDVLNDPDRRRTYDLQREGVGDLHAYDRRGQRWGGGSSQHARSPGFGGSYGYGSAGGHGYSARGGYGSGGGYGAQDGYGYGHAGGGYGHAGGGYGHAGSAQGGYGGYSFRQSFSGWQAR